MGRFVLMGLFWPSLRKQGNLSSVNLLLLGFRIHKS